MKVMQYLGRGRGHSMSLDMTPFDRSHMTFYYSSCFVKINVTDRWTDKIIVITTLSRADVW